MVCGGNPNYLGVKASDLKVSFAVEFNNVRLYNAFRAKQHKVWACANGKATYTF